MKDPIIKTIHVREATLEISKPDLLNMMQTYAFRATGFDPVATQVTVNFVDAMEGGSIPYKVGTRCVVKLVEDQMMLDGA